MSMRTRIRQLCLRAQAHWSFERHVRSCNVPLSIRWQRGGRLGGMYGCGGRQPRAPQLPIVLDKYRRSGELLIGGRWLHLGRGRPSSVHQLCTIRRPSRLGGYTACWSARPGPVTGRGRSVDLTVWRCTAGAADVGGGWWRAIQRVLQLRGAERIHGGGGCPARRSLHRSVFLFDNWVQIAELNVPDGIRGDWFGYSVSIHASSSLLVAGGAIRADAGQVDSGAVCVFRDGVLEARVTPSTKHFQGGFGWSVAVARGDRILVGEKDPPVGSSSGRGILFAKVGNHWVEDVEFVPSAADPPLSLGSSVSATGMCRLLSRVLLEGSASMVATPYRRWRVGDSGSFLAGGCYLQGAMESARGFGAAE